MTIIQDEGQWHLEEHLTAALVVTAGSIYDNTVLLNRPGQFLGCSCIGNEMGGGLQYVVEVLGSIADGSGPLTVGKNVTGIRVFGENIESADTLTMKFILMVWIRD